QGSQKRSNSTPETPRPKRAPLSRSPYGLFSPGSFSPSVTPSQKYSSRGGRGEVVASFGSVQGPAWRGGGGGCPVGLFGGAGQSLSKPYRFMFQKALDVREGAGGLGNPPCFILVSCPRSVTPSQKYSSRGGRGEVVASFGSVQGPAWRGGGGGCPVGLFGGAGQSLSKPYRFMFQKALDVREVGGAQVPLDLSELPEYSLFPGQVVALEGTNSTGKRMVVSKLYEVTP
ncbi:DPOA2 polymerase, partial [Thryothorus ludovicianus]|nr:DPOA2 polymerase [Thryothorus ludovicianus]